MAPLRLIQAQELHRGEAGSIVGGLKVELTLAGAETILRLSLKLISNTQ